MAASKYEVDDEDGPPDDESLGTGDVSSGTEESTDDDFDEVEGGLTDNQARLLYMFSLYTHPAETEEEDERWMRKQAAMVLLYEGVVAKVFDYDYAPSSELVEGRRMYFNISQEGRSDIDFLREEELLNGLKIPARDHVPVTMYQVSIKGLDAVRRVSRFDKEAVHKLCFSPYHSLMSVQWDNNNYWLVAADPDPDGEEYRVASSVLDTEDVSYVSSAYIPACLRQGGRPTMSNAHRATESGASQSTLRDELDVVITLNSVSVIVAEYIPFGANQMVELNNHMGSTDRVQGGFFANIMDDDSAGTSFKMPPGLTAVSILDYSLTNHVNFEADIRMPEAEGIVQIETFGCSINSYGTLYYGLQLEAVMDRVKDGISLDHLSRLLADVHNDSSRLIDALLSVTQRTILDFIFRGDADNRNKVNLIVCNEINPHLTAEEYMDKGEYENELKQVLGDTRAAFDITQYDTLVFGAYGILLAGPNSRTYEPLLCAYLQYISLDIFIRNLYNRIAIVIDDVELIRDMVEEALADPMVLRQMRIELPKAERKVLIMTKTLAYIGESLEDMTCPQPPTQQAGRALYDRLALPRMQMELARRITDLTKSVDEVRGEYTHAEKLCDDLRRVIELQTQESIRVQTYESVQATKEVVKSQPTFELILLCLAGTLAFDFLDRVTGNNWTVVDSDWFKDAAEALLGTPAVWLGISLVFWASFTSCCCWWIIRRYKRAMTGVLNFRVEMLTAIDLPKFGQFLAKKKLFSEFWDAKTYNDRIVVSWDEVDKAMIHCISATYQRNSARPDVAFTTVELKDRVMDELGKAGVLPSDPRAPPLVMGRKQFGKKKVVPTGLPPKRKEALKEAEKSVAEGTGDA